LTPPSRFPSGLFGKLICAIRPAQASASQFGKKAGDVRFGSTIVTRERRLYYFVGAGEAIRYPVGIGRDGLTARMARYFEHLSVAPGLGFGGLRVGPAPLARPST
jgi:hypothetical protein